MKPASISASVTFKSVYVRVLFTVLFFCGLHGNSLFGQEYTLTYEFPEGMSLKYKRIVEENAYAELHSNLATEIFKKKESFFSVTGAGNEDDLQVITYLQDTVYVEETPPPPDYQQSIRINNILTQVPIRLSITARGKLVNAIPERSLVDVKGLKEQNFNERQLANMAMFLPKLPDEPVEVGKMWSASSQDTLVPNPDLGKRNSLRIQTVNVSYRAEEMETLSGYDCLKITWEGTTLMEEKHIEDGQERFIEETTVTNGTYYFATAESLLVKLDQEAHTEMTTVFYGEKNGIIPYTNTIQTTITLQEKSPESE